MADSDETNKVVYRGGETDNQVTITVNEANNEVIVDVGESGDIEQSNQVQANPNINQSEPPISNQPDNSVDNQPTQLLNGDPPPLESTQMNQPNGSYVNQSFEPSEPTTSQPETSGLKSNGQTTTTKIFPKQGDRTSLDKDSRITISFHNITYQIPKKLDDIPFCGKKTTLTILDKMSGIFTPGLNAVMGPTGSGKTTLLDVLAQRKNPKFLVNGFVLVNGEKPPSNFRHISGYVLQDCILSPHLTVRENLEFSANLRLPWSKYDKAARKRKVTEVIRLLKLEAVGDTLVGDELKRGLSGGERKRTNIGMEMILDPPLLFLDEPTSGLDANTANDLILLLSNMAKEGQNIILSIHQPRHSIFTMFDKLIILHKGQFVYRGPADEAVTYFDELGYKCPPMLNPADFFLDIVGGNVEMYNVLKRIGSLRLQRAHSIKEIISKFSTTSRRVKDNREEKLIKGYQKTSLNLIGQFEKSSFNKEENDVLQEIKEIYKGENGEVSSLQRVEIKTSYANGFLPQLKVVGGRTALNLFRNPITTALQMLVLVAFAVVIGIVFFQIDYSFTSGIQNRVGSLFFVLTIQIAYNLTALGNLIQDRARYVHESIAGYYRVSVYFISQLLADLLPNRVVTNVVFGTIIYFLVGLNPQADKFLIFLLVLILFAMTGGTAIFLISLLFSTYSTAYIVASVGLIMMLMFAGFLVNITSLMAWLEWIKYLSIMRYGINALSNNEMTGNVFIENSSFPGYDPNSVNPCISTLFNISVIPKCITAEDYLTSQGVPLGVWGLWSNIVALGSILLILLVISYIALRRINKYI